MNILFLHGYAQSGALFSAKTKAIQKPLLKALPGTTLHFPTAPHRLQPSDFPGQSEDSSTPAPQGSGDSNNWGWWRKDPVTGECIGLEETWRFLTAYLEENGPFTGIVGFSQGGALAAMLAAVLEKSTRKVPTGFDKAAAGQPPARFVAVYSGFRLPEQYEEAYYLPKITTPVLHIIGSLDTVVEEARSLKLIEACEGDGGNVVYHPGGHYIPSNKQMTAVLVGYIRAKSSEATEASRDEDARDMDVPL